MAVSANFRSTLYRYLTRFGKPVRGFVPAAVRHAVRRRLVDPRPRIEIYMDLVGTCNLRCPSCPVGNTSPTSGSGLLDLELFESIIEKAAREYNVSFVGLFNWTEPMIHPRLPDFIRTVHKYGIKCHLSSNLNLLRNPDAVLAEAPEYFRISLSGFRQETYGVTHAAGDIEKVKRNMKLLAESKRRVGNTTTNIQVCYHRYLHNLSELTEMQEYAASLGFGWYSNWAYLLPIEKAMELAEDRLPERDAEFVDSQFALPTREAVKVAKEFRDAPCRLLKEQLVLDMKGNVVLCCTVYDLKNNALGNFLSMSVADFMKAKEGHPTCDRCMANGLHSYASYHENPQLQRIYDNLAAENIARRGSSKSKRLPVVDDRQRGS